MKSVPFFTGLAMAMMLMAVPEATAADQPIIAGLGCGLDTVEDPRNPGTYTGTIYGGPVYAGSQARPVTSAYLICTVQVGALTHAGPDRASVMTWGMGTTAIAPTPVAYQADDDEPVVVCSEVWIDTGDGHVTLFFNSLTREFSLDPHGTCEELIEIGSLGGSRSAEPDRAAHVHLPTVLTEMPVG